MSVSRVKPSALSRGKRSRGLWSVDSFQCIIKPLCVVSVGISLDFIGLGAEPGVLHSAELSLDCAAHFGEDNFLCHAGRVVLVGPQQTMFFFEQRVYLTTSPGGVW